MAAAARTSMLRSLQTVRQFSSSSASLQEAEKAAIKVFGVEGRYAHALFSAASRTKALDKVEGELNKVQGLLQNNEKLSAYCKDPTVNKNDKQDVIVQVLKDNKFSDLTVNFMGVLAEGNRLKRVDGVISSFNKIMRARRGEVDCTVTTAKELDKATMKTLTGTLNKFVKSNETLKIDTKVDKELIGGMVINLGDYFIDMSTATKIKKLSRALKGEE
ncbi:ATP synthase subunit O, mitochondrial-like [Clytia hemisphaerica]|uniref:ATP synthase peripheral stalk subunit OSCP, mitochondrial n=1 Tax=Clytia hemisphaerica TaxID=252671 RepID=A0A7M5WQ77_9CNID|eukprot:TCONS_00011025-protein